MCCLKPASVVLLPTAACAPTCWLARRHFLQALERTAESKRWQRAMHTPANVDDVFIPFKPRHVATVRGKLADVPPKAGHALRGVLVKQQGQDQVMHPDELSTFTQLAAGTV